MDQTFKPTINLKEYVHPNAKIFVHVEPWFIPGNDHQKQSGITYDSRDPAVIARQVSEIKAMGIDGINVNWYGPNNKDLEAASHGLLVECHNQGLLYSLCPDKGIFSNYPKSQWQAVMSGAMKWVKQYYTSSPAYWTINGRPVINFFLNPDLSDWASIRAIIPNALFLFENKSGYDHPESDGAYAWVNAKFDGVDTGLAYLQDFYSRTAPAGKITLGGAWPGFNDNLASWGTNRVVPRNNGCTLFSTLGALPQSVDYVLISTFNDHQEGSAIEFGIAQHN